MPRSLPIAMWVIFALGAGAAAQVPLDPARNPDLVSLLDVHDAEPTISCDVRTFQPQLSFDFRFQAGYTLYVPLKQYLGEGNELSAVTRITPQHPVAPPVYLTQSIDLPNVPRKNKADIQLVGGYFVGEGKYDLDLLVLDQAGRTCRKHWDMEAHRSGHAKDIPLRIAPGAVAPFTFATWRGVFDRRKNDHSHRPRITILFHVAPLFRRNMNLRSYDQEMLLGSLTSLVEEIPSSQLKLIAFNLDQQTELFRQDDFDGSGWDHLLESMEKLQLGTVSYDTLAHREGHVDLLKKLVDEELDASSRSDAVIFLGPTARQSDKPALLPRREEGAQPLFFYFEYKPYWFRGADFPDVVGHVTHALAGKVFRIHSPPEFADAIKAVRASLEERPVPGTQ